MSNASSILPDDPAFLKAMITALQAENAKMSAALKAHDRLIQGLRLRIARSKKQIFGKSSETIEREIAQLELALEGLLIASVEHETAPWWTGATVPCRCMKSDLLHADDTPIRVLDRSLRDKGLGKGVKKGGTTYVRDQ